MDRTKYLSLEEVKHLRTVSEALALRDLEHGRTKSIVRWMLVDMALGTGLRGCELRRIKVADLDLKRGILAVQRGKKKRARVESLNLGPDLVKHLRDYLDWRRLADIESEYLFTSVRGPLSICGIRAMWKTALVHAGLTKVNELGQTVAAYSIHCARHTVGTHLLKKTHNLRQVQKQLGHEDPAITAKFYADVSDDDMRAGMDNLYG